MGGSGKKKRRAAAKALAEQKQNEYESYAADKTQDLNTARTTYLDFKAELEGRKQKMAEGASAYEAKAMKFAEDRKAYTDQLKTRHGAHYTETGKRRVVNYKVGYGVDYDPEREMKYLEKYAGVKDKKGNPVIDQAKAEHMMEKALAFGDTETIEMVQKKLQETGYDQDWNEKKAIDAANEISDEETAQQADLKAAYEAEAPMMSFAEWEAANYGSGG